jgi:hypothetical protein
MERQKARKPLSPVKQRLKNLIAEYKDAQREHREAAQRLDGALASLSAARLRLAAHVEKHQIDSYRAIFAVERDKNGKLTSRRIVGGKNLAIKGVIWPAEVGPDRGQASTGHGGPQTPDCGAYCDEQMESAPDDPNWTGEVWCVCDCTLSAGGGAFPGALQCFGEDEIPEETVEEA